MSASMATAVASVENQCAVCLTRRVWPSRRNSAAPRSANVNAELVAIRPIGWYGSARSVSRKKSWSMPASHSNTRSASVTSPIASTSRASPRATYHR
jgi:hypothetical protein